MAGIFIPGNTISLGAQGSGGGAYSPIGASFDAVYTQDLYSDFGVASTAAAIHSVVRASPKYALDTAGLYTSVSANTLARSNREARIEESRTNSIRNNSMQGAAAGAPGTLPTNWSIGQQGTLSREVVGVGTEDGIEYIDLKLSGTTSTTTALIYPEGFTQIVASNGQVWGNSAFIKIVGGSTSNVTSTVLSARMSDGGGANIGAVTSVALTLATSSASLGLSRQRGVLTLTNASTAFATPAVALNFSSGVAIDITLRIGWPQFELLPSTAATASSPIRTTNVAATREADAVTISSAYAALSQGSVALVWLETLGAIGAERHLWTQYVDANNYIRARITSGNKVEVIIVSGGVTQAQLTSTNNVAAGNTYRLAFRYGANDVAAAFTTALQASVLTDTSATMPTGTHVIGIGQSGASASYLNDGVVRVTAFPRKLADAELNVQVAA